MGCFSYEERTWFLWARSYVQLNQWPRRTLTHVFDKDLDQEDDVPLRQVDFHALEQYYKKDLKARSEKEDAKAQILFEKRGFCKEGGEGDGY